MHGPKKRRKAPSDFARQKNEKQKFKVSYGVDERNLARIFREVQGSGKDTAGEFVRALESRIDNVVFRLGFGRSRAMARKMVLHGHIMVNGKKVTSPGFVTKTGDAISIRPESRVKKQFGNLKEFWKSYDMPTWLVVDEDKEEGKIIAPPDETQIPFETSLLIESFSK
jgi:small subunit ribosomal protein S4